MPIYQGTQEQVVGQVCDVRYHIATIFITTQFRLGTPTDDDVTRHGNGLTHAPHSE